MVARSHNISLALALANIFLAWPAHALDPIVVLEPSGVPEGYGTGFGDGVALSDYWMVIGAPADFSAGAADSGSAYVYRREGVNWIEHQKLLGDGWTNERFGWSIAMDSDWLMISAPRFSNFCCPTGRVYAFRRNANGTRRDLRDDSWDLTQIINEDLSLCCVGAAIALDRDVLLIGGPQPQFDPGTELGKAYIFEREGDSWAQTQTISPSQPRPGDDFGGAVAVRGSTMAISGQYTGAVYMFRRGRGGWQEQQKLCSSDGCGGRFGSSIALSESTLLVGDPSRNASYVFENSPEGWAETHKLVAWDSGAGQYPQFGTNVALHENLIAVAAYDQPWVYTFKLDQESCSPYKALNGTAGVVIPMTIATDSRFLVARDHIYAVGPVFDLAQFALFQNCVGGNRRQSGGACSPFDLEPDRKIDADDLPFFLLTLRGPE